MTATRLWTTLALTFLFASPAVAADLAKVDRSIVREPAYQSTPKYCLLVFGPQAKHKAWLVLDGKTLYVDRKGTADLTRPECRVRSKADRYVECLFEAGDLCLDGVPVH